LVQSYVDIAFNSGALIYPYVERNLQRPTAAFPLVRGVTVPVGEQDFTRAGLYVRSNESARVSAVANLSTGGFYGGSLQRAVTSARWLPDPHASFAVAYELNRLRGVGAPAADATTHLLAPEMRLALNPRVQLTAFYQYNSDAERGTLNARFSWEFAPLSYLYVVVNDRRTTRSPSLGSVAGLPADQLLVKFVYLWQL
jgi:hypothetical protein